MFEGMFKEEDNKLTENGEGDVAGDASVADIEFERRRREMEEINTVSGSIVADEEFESTRRNTSLLTSLRIGDYFKNSFSIEESENPTT